MLKIDWFKVVYNTVYEEPTNTEPPTNDPPANDPPKTEGKNYTEEEFKAAVSNERKRHEQAVRKHIEELNNLKKSSSTTQEEKERLAARVSDLENSLLTKEELTKKAEKEAANKHKKEVETLASERDNWRRRFESSYVRRALVDSAAKADAHNPEHFISLLEPVTKLVPITNSEGKLTDDFEVKVSFKQKDKETGEVKELFLPPDDVVKLMKEDTDTHGYLFKGVKAAGTGMNGGTGGPKLSPNMSMTEYMASGRKTLLGQS